MLNNDENSNKNYLIQKLEEQYNSQDVEKILAGYNCKRIVSFRVNTLKTTREKVIEVLDNEQIEYEKVLWSEDAFIIKNRSESDLEQLDIYKNGEIYLQSLSSMLPPIIMKPEAKEDILDMAAAPGGKTTQICAITQNNASVTACEMNKIRAEKLKYNIEKQGASAYVMETDARTINEYFSFDRILLDAPCSGSGTLSFEDESSFKYFSQRLVEKSAKTQMILLKKALSLLKPGKEMVYSTCSILSIENEEIVMKALENVDAEIIPIDFPGKDELPLLETKLPGTLCVCPNELYEGFYIAKIKRNS